MKQSPLKEEAQEQRQWSKDYMPLLVLYSPLLRLRFRSALAKVVDNINNVTGSALFTKPKEAPNSLAVDLESVPGLHPPYGMIYVRDCESRKDTEGHIAFWSDDNLVCAVVMLPENENSPYSTVDVTTQMLLRLLLVPAELGINFSEKTIDFLEKAYSK